MWKWFVAGQFEGEPTPLGAPDAALLDRAASRQGHPQVPRSPLETLLGRHRLRRGQVCPIRRKGLYRNLSFRLQLGSTDHSARIII